MPYRPDLDYLAPEEGEPQLQPGEWYWDEAGIVARIPSGVVWRPRYPGHDYDTWEVTGPRHAPDVYPSIHVWHERPDGSRQTDWHGYLTKGQWKEVPGL